MPIFHLKDDEMHINIIVEAKSESAARLHLVRHVVSKHLTAKELAELVMSGDIAIERATGKAPETVQA